ncbi:MAG TPA: NADH-quinone oxidoreductase subunit NuoH [bacterium]
MKEFADIIRNALPVFKSIPDALYYGIWMLLVAGALLGVVSVIAGITSWVERRVAGRMMSRFGPNRVGPQGSLQWIADGIKCLLKEDLIPALADKPLFRLAPYIVFAGMFATWVVFPFSKKIIVADLNIGILYVLAVSSLVVIGILMAGWASNNKWSLLGAMRAVAQIVSYEVPSVLAVLSVVLVSGTLSMQGIVEHQRGGSGVLRWNIFHDPFLFIAFFVFFIAQIAEGNRTPFDLPEAESELVAGYSTEYSGMRFVMFYFAEWANLFVIGAVSSTLFFGGWEGPFIAGIHWFILKSCFFVFLLMWIRWTLPRLRVDQLMTLSWKYLTPFAFVCLVGAAAWILFLPDRYFMGMLK